jgi:mRNA-degrading endonuclease toxin of MazEF toxin-antitoxin module
VGTCPRFTVVDNGSVSGSVTVVPLAKREGRKRKVYPFEVLSPDLVGTGLESIVMPQQVRTISKLRLLTRIGALSD